MKVIIHVLAMNSFSGAENVAITLIRSLQGQGGYRFIYASPDGPIRQVVEENGIEFAPLRKLCLSELRRLFKAYQPDIIHAHDYTAGLLCAATAGRTPVISHLHNNPPWLKSVNPRTLAYGLSCLRHRKILGVSQAVFDDFIFGRLFRRKQLVVGNPAEPEHVRRRAQQEPAVQGFDVVFLGRFMPQKNPLLFLQVIESLRALRPETTAVMIGEGELRPDIETFIREHGLQSAVTLTGFLNNPHPILAASRVLCMTSSWEGFGLVAGEALALGKPVAATPVGGIPAIITGDEGCLCESKEEFVRFLLTMLTEPVAYAQRSAAALRRADEMSNLDAYTQLLADLYG